MTSAQRGEHVEGRHHVVEQVGHQQAEQVAQQGVLVKEGRRRPVGANLRPVHQVVVVEPLGSVPEDVRLI